MRIHLGSFIIETSDSERFTKYRFLLNADVRVVIGDLPEWETRDKSYLNSKGNSDWNRVGTHPEKSLVKLDQQRFFEISSCPTLTVKSWPLDKSSCNLHRIFVLMNLFVWNFSKKKERIVHSV